MHLLPEKRYIRYNPHSLSPLKTEALTRKEINDKKLQAASWNLGDHSHVAEEYCIEVGLPEGVSVVSESYQVANP